MGAISITDLSKWGANSDLYQLRFIQIIIDHSGSHFAHSLIMANPATLKSKPDGFNLYARFALAGALGCSVTHSAFTPVDVYVLI